MHEAYHKAMDYLVERCDKALEIKEMRAYELLAELAEAYERHIFPIGAPDEGSPEHPLNQETIDD